METLLAPEAMRLPMQHNSLSCFSHSVSYSHAVYYKHAAGIFRNSYGQDVDVSLYAAIFLVGCSVVCSLSPAVFTCVVL